MFLPGYAVIGKLLKGETVARKFGVQVGDCIVAVNGHGYRRFAPDFKEKDLTYLNNDVDSPKIDKDVELDHQIVHAGDAYDQMLSKIKAIKAAAPDPPLILTLERYGWDARCNSWPRFLAARDNNVPDAMMMQQQHETWKGETFPIDLTKGGLQEIFKSKAVSEIDVEFLKDFPPTVYVNYGKLQQMEKAGEITADEVVEAFLIFTERMLKKSHDPRHPRTCQFIDLSGVSITGGFRVEILKRIYKVFEPNYPETLYKMVMFPVSNMVVSTEHDCQQFHEYRNQRNSAASTTSDAASSIVSSTAFLDTLFQKFVISHQAMTARSLLSFVNEKTQSKFLITNSLEKVCEELGWDQREVEGCGGVTEFMHKHEKLGDAYLF